MAAEVAPRQFEYSKRPDADVIDAVIEEIESLEATSATGDAPLSVKIDPIAMTEIMTDTYEQAGDSRIVEAFLDTSTPYSAELVVMFENEDEATYTLMSSMPEAAASATLAYRRANEAASVGREKDMTVDDLAVVARAVDSVQPKTKPELI